MKNILLTLILLFSLKASNAQTLATNKEQFVLFDVQFNYTKFEADHSLPNKSHFYVKGDLINRIHPTKYIFQE